MSNSEVAPILYCSKCGSPTSAYAQFCNNCGTPLPAASTIAFAPVYARNYGGFWMRFLAYVIDAVVVGILCSPVVIFALGGALPRIIADASQNREPDPAMVFAMMGRFLTMQLLVQVIAWIYEAYMLSSDRQATVGKIALGLKVTDVNGRRISFARATGRHFAKILSGMVMMIGFIMAAFTERKQALHDILASTIVVKA
jgi:uncharacterized RDD family membrane protein YckC